MKSITRLPITGGLHSSTALGLILIIATAALAAEPTGPIRLHPDNPHYFLWREKPTVLVGSGEHYGAVLNRDFDYDKYLAELAARKLNHTRTFTGVYCEPQGAFNIARNTLAPGEGRLLAPWARSDKPGYAGGGNRFDLTRFDDAYFARLKDFVHKAGAKGVVVELDLFCPMYEDKQWNLSPQNAANNVNGLGKIGRSDVHTLDKNGDLLAVQEALVRKIAAELNDCDNLYYEICNEPYFGGVTMAWQERMIAVLREAERGLPNKHLISLNIANLAQKIERAHPDVNIFNFHYCNPPDTVADNYRHLRAIGDNETGFKGTADLTYRREAWQFFLAGGALFGHLDYSFTVGNEDGSFAYPPSQPGGGGPSFRSQMTALRQFLESFDFVRMQPNRKLLSGATGYVLAQSGKQYAVYLPEKTKGPLKLEMPAGKYQARWIDPTSGKTIAEQAIAHAGGLASISVPAYEQDAALEIKLSGDKAG